MTPDAPVSASSVTDSVSTRVKVPTAMHRPMLGSALLVSDLWVLSELDTTGKYLLSMDIP